ncbi:MAG: hypothetical protein WA885_07665 [Phormidesmis sp.]
MDVSLRKALNCVDAPADEASVLRHFFGFLDGRPVGLGTISVRDQLEALRGDHVHLDIMLVVPEDFVANDLLELAFGIQGARDILGQVGIGIGRVRYHEITRDQADGAEVITSKGEAKRLTRRFRGSSDDAMDVFMVPQYNVFSGGENKIGICSIPTCFKNHYVFNGCVIGFNNNNGPISAPKMPRLLAHELGHGLGRIHRNISGNLMESDGFGTSLTEGQGRRMRRDCFVQDGCDI